MLQWHYAKLPGCWALSMWLTLAGCTVYDELELAQPDATQVGVRDVPAANPLPSVGPKPGVAAQDAANVMAIPDGATRALTCANAIEATPCDALPQLTTAPTFDGKLECGLLLHTLPLGLEMEASLTDAGDNEEMSVLYAAAWTDSGLYIYIEVHATPSPAAGVDEPLYCSDAVEIFVDSDGQPGLDGAYDSPGTMQLVIAAPSADAMPPSAGRYVGGQWQGPWISESLHASRLADGYVVEALIAAADLGLWSWQPRGQLGFNIAVDLGGAGAPRTAPCSNPSVGQSVLKSAPAAQSCDGKPWCDTRSFCLPRLSS